MCLAGCADPQFLAPDASAAADAEPFETDAGESGLVKPTGPCVDRPSVLGAECPGVVWCTDRGLCDQSQHICCTSALTADCSARENCGLEQQLRCDGPEDCRGGKVCCAREGATLCLAPQECSESMRACHTDADCEKNHCARGIPGTFSGVPVTFFVDWGFCRMP